MCGQEQVYLFALRQRREWKKDAKRKLVEGHLQSTLWSAILSDTGVSGGVVLQFAVAMQWCAGTVMGGDGIFKA